MKLVSVVVPVYNVEAYIAETIQSILNQTYSNFEILIVNDGSSDRSVEIIQTFDDPRITVMHQENQGVSAARNRGISQAKGEYIGLIDGDDIWTPEKLEKHVEHLERSPQIGLSFCRSAFIDLKGNPLGIYQMPRLNNIEPHHILCRNPIGNGSVPVIRRAALEAIKHPSSRNNGASMAYFDESLHNLEDVECWLRIALQSEWQVEGIPEALTLYRVNLAGASTKVDQQIASLEKMLLKTGTYAPELVAEWGSMARAYQIRFLSRRMVSLGNGKKAVQLANKALVTSWKIARDEPQRTFLTLAAAYSLYLLPPFIYKPLEARGMKMTGLAQQKRILQEQKN
ncbi:glycosyltransferase family 2 protein [Laspinema olomoucense]|uniref:glycosyltransferase family 2 protein n=1 Tax=Laspinema olomoucense TaxID=3231600 RepID=UPI0021BA60C3|nr:glycosyltransferase family A protein [Laspinema sp. D3c]MCT7995077.1 glycosyltransferase family 2 protein [Laspinema sp. D3c]